MMKLILKNAKMISVFVLMLCFLGCADDDEDNLPRVTALFTQTVNENTGTVTFINISDNATNYLWDFGDDEISTQINPVKTYENGTFIVTLVASNLAGASGVFSDTLTIKIKEAVKLPISFDDANVNYTATGFSGAAFEVVNNPDVSGQNASASKVGEIKNSGASFEGIFFSLGTSIDLASDKTIGMNFWSDQSVEVLLKLEEGTASVEQTANHDGTGWETIYFNFDSDGQFSRFTLFVDSPGTTSGTFFIDNILQTFTICRDNKIQLPIDFDCEGTPYRLETFGGTSFEVITNPEISGINNIETNVGKIVNSGAAFEGGTFSLGSSLDLSVGDAVSIKLFSTVAIPVLLKLEGTSSIENSVNHGGSGWEKLIFNYTSEEEFEQLTLLLDATGTTSGTFYVDDIIQTESDRVAPVITLIGAATNNLLVGTTFTDPGASATDNVDGDISANIVVTGTVDVNTVGNYTLQYNVSDAAGNAAVEVIRTIVIEANDTTAPVITLIGNASINIDLGNAFTDPGATATDNVDGNLSNNIVVTGTINVNTEGTYTLRYNVSDAAGNAATEVTRTVIVSNSGGAFDGGLLINGDFEGGNVAWSGNAFNIVIEGGNGFNFANVATAGQPFDVNLSQAVTLVQGSNYILSFEASSDVSRTMIAGIGQSVDPFTADTQTVNLTTTTQTFTLNLTATDFGGVNSRVLFDMGAAVGVVVIDNVSLTLGGSGSGGTGGGGTDPNLTVAAPTPPARDAADVISLFSDAYTNINVETWSASFDNSSVEDIQVVGDNVKKITFTNFLGVEFLNDRIDATDFTTFHIDIFTTSETLDKSFNLKFSDWAGGNGENSAIEYSINNAATPGLPNPNPGTWISLDIPMSSWTSAVNGLSRADLAQFIITSNLGVVFVDNIYFYK